MNCIEKALQTNSMNSEQSILMGQWEFDRKSIPAALKVIAIVFPHYSLHDESHSSSILNNIVRLLGEHTISELSCTDLWLLLESAYCHDLGMIVTSSRLEDALNSEDFLCHFLKLQADDSHPCNKYTKDFQVVNNRVSFRDGVLKPDSLDSIRFILADFFRERHAKNSKSTVMDPFGQAGIESPRSIIPSRLFAILSKICEAHTRSFDEVMKLPKNEDGIGLDECHPRFVACMLRLGDLLDIDNNRFSESLMKTIKQLPLDSKCHFEKHKAISHLSINTKSIEIEAICDTPRVAQVIQDWFDWIRDEVNVQTLKWNRIVPSGLNCYLPTLEYLRIKIEGYETISGNKKPKFTIDTSKALELLQGRNFYKDPFDSIREIIQNAVDSTLVKIYLDGKKQGIAFESPGESFFSFAKDYSIVIKLIEKQGRCSVEVKDKGVGLKRDQLKFLINTGSSSSNVEKQLIINNMPEWMRPSGVFGIGFQSIFLLTDKVEVQTKDCFNDEKMWIEMHGPNSQMRGDVYLKVDDCSFDTGFTIKFDIDNERKEESIEDPFNAFQQNVELSKVASKIREYAEESLVPIIIERDMNSCCVREKIDRQSFDFFDKDTGIELYFPDQSFKMDSTLCPKFFYRNARIQGGDLGTYFLAPVVNVHFGSAKDLLTLNRDSFKEERTVVDKTIHAIIAFLNSKGFSLFLKRLGSSAEMALYKFALFVEYFDKTRDVNNAHLLPRVGDMPLDFMGINKTIKEVVSFPRLRFRTASNNVFKTEIVGEELIIEGNTLAIFSPSIVSGFVKLLFKLASFQYKHCFCTKKVLVSFVVGAEFLFTNIDALSEVELSLGDIMSNIEFASRNYINFIAGYEDIRIPSTIELPISNSLITPPFRSLKVEKIVSPFITVNKQIYDCRNDALYEYVSSVTGKSIDAVRNSYDRLVEELGKLGKSVLKE